jgi:hypothetical protein
MRRTTVAVVLALTLAGLACEDQFSPKGTFESRVFLYCIVNFTKVDKTLQFALVNRSYDVEGTNPLVNTQDPFLDGAEIKLTVRNMVYAFRKTVADLPETTRYGSPFRCYRARDVLIFTNDTVHVVAYVPNGPPLTGQTIVPRTKPMESQPRYVVGFTTLVNRSTYGNDYVLDWNDASHDEHLFFPSLSITYLRYDSTEATPLAIQVPLKYVDQGGRRVPVYPSPTTVPHLTFPFEVIDETMREISAGDSSKSRYAPLMIKFSVVDCDFPLSRYYMGVNGSMDQYSLRLEESVFTNVQGGGGIVGSTNTYGIDYDFDPRYLKTFGYSPR